MGEVGADVKKRQRGESVGSVLLAAEDGKVELADHSVAQFMSQGEQRIADDEPDELVTPLRVESRDPALEAASVWPASLIRASN